MCCFVGLAHRYLLIVSNALRAVFLHTAQLCLSNFLIETFAASGPMGLGSATFFMPTDVLALQEMFLLKTANFSISWKVVHHTDWTAHCSQLFSPLHPFFLPPASTEVLSVRVKVSPTCTLKIINLYVLQGLQDMAWLQHFANNCHPPMSIVRDFNGHHSYGGEHDLPNVTIIVDWITNNICITDVNKYTHISSRGTISLIDPSFVSPDLSANTNLLVHPHSFNSKHFPVMEISLQSTKVPNRNLQTFYCQTQM